MGKQISLFVKEAIDRWHQSGFEYLSGKLLQLAENRGVEERNGIFHIGPYPEFGEDYFACILYPPIQNLESNTDWERIPPSYRSFLATVANGARFYSISLYGIRCQSNRNQTLSILDANRNWRVSYPAPQEMVHFGKRTISFDENAGYFMAVTGECYGMSSTGEVIESASNITKLINDEVDTAISIELKVQLELAKIRKR